jgi:nucleoside-diphosphate-sugar epimerase
VGNVVDAAVAVAGNPKTDGKVYIVTDGRSYSVREIYESIARGLGKTPSHFHVPTDVAKGFALLGDLGGRVLGRRVPFDSDALRKLTSSYAFSSGRLRGDLGFRPRYDLFNSIGETIDWYRRDACGSRKG